MVAADYLVGLLAGRGEMERNTDRDVSNQNKHTSIADNPSAKKVSDYLLLARIVRLTTGFSKTLGITNATVDRLHHSADKALRQSDILTLPDRFNAAFASEGWIATGSMSADTIRKAVKLYESGKKQEAQDEILAWFQEDTINLLAWAASAAWLSPARLRDVRTRLPSIGRVTLPLLFDLPQEPPRRPPVGGPCPVVGDPGGC